VRVPLTFAAGRGRARAARLTLKQSEADLVRLEQDIAIAITAVAGQIVTTKQRVEVTRAYVDLAQQAMENEEKRFATGTPTSTTFLVSNAQQELAIAQRNHAIALADQRRAIASYDRELGTTLIKWGVKTD
jgi:outer membrane protein